MVGTSDEKHVALDPMIASEICRERSSVEYRKKTIMVYSIMECEGD